MPGSSLPRSIQIDGDVPATIMGGFIKYLIYVHLCFNIHSPIRAYYQALEVCHYLWRSCANDSERKGWSNEQPQKASDPGNGSLQGSAEQGSAEQGSADLDVAQGQNVSTYKWPV